MKHVAVFGAGIALASIGIAVCAYKVMAFGVPLTPASQTRVWTVEGRASFEARSGPVKARLVIPHAPPGFRLLDEDFVSTGFGITTDVAGANRLAIFTIRRASGLQTLYYRATFSEPSADISRDGPFPGYPQTPTWEEPLQSAVTDLIEQVRAESADIATFTRLLIEHLAVDGDDEAVQMLRRSLATPHERVRLLVRLLAAARIPARVVYGLALQDGLRDAPLVPWLEVHDEDTWLAFDPARGTMGYPERFLVWRVGAGPAVTVSQTEPDTREVRVIDEVDFGLSATSSVREVMRVAEREAALRGSRLMDFSLTRLPVQTQNVYKILLTVPLGAFLVVLLRNVGGVSTFGTFMPVLIALAFRETRLLWGVVLFTLLVTIGLALRFALERMKLLLVPRLTAVLIIVILMMLVVTQVSFQLGLERGLSVALFPMVILAMTIERMSVVWEEHGRGEALVQGIGSLLVAVIAYLAMNNALTRHLSFVFPELLLVLLGATLVLGRYTGYRISELWRFRSAWLGRET